MAGFYDDLDGADVATLDRLSKLLIDLREARAALLARHAAASEEELLEKLRTGALPEHDAYEDYLGARVVEATREALRNELRDYLLQVQPVRRP
jgi:hypothetical protein